MKAYGVKRHWNNEWMHTKSSYDGIPGPGGDIHQTYRNRNHKESTRRLGKRKARSIGYKEIAEQISELTEEGESDS